MRRVKLRPSQRLTVVLFWGLFGLFCAILIGRLLFGAVDGTITVGKPTQSGRLIPKTVPTDVTQESIYGQFIVPSDFKKMKASTPVFPVLENNDFIKSRGGYNEIAVQVVKLISGSLSDDGIYNLHTSQPDRFEKSTVVVQGRSALMFYDAQNNSGTVYLQRGDIVVHVTLTGPMATEAGNVSRLANNWQWK
jgi:hypothetical protein